MRRQWLRLALRRPGRSTQVTESGSHGTWGGAQEPERHHGRNLAAVEAAMALLLQASLLFQSGQTAMAETFCRARLGNERSLVYGALDTQAPVAALIARALPEL